MNITPVPHVDRPALVEAVTVPLATVVPMADAAAGAAAPAAPLAETATVELSPLGRAAARIGCVTDDPQRFVQMDTRFGGRRVVDWLSGEQLPRIC